MNPLRHATLGQLRAGLLLMEERDRCPPGHASARLVDLQCDVRNFRELAAFHLAVQRASEHVDHQV